MIQAGVENKYGLDIQVSAAGMADKSSSGRDVFRLNLSKLGPRLNPALAAARNYYAAKLEFSYIPPTIS